MAKKPTSPEAEPRGFAPGTLVQLADGRQGKLLSRAQDSYPPGWYVEGIPGAVAESSLALVESPEPRAD